MILQYTVIAAGMIISCLYLRRLSLSSSSSSRSSSRARAKRVGYLECSALLTECHFGDKRCVTLSYMTSIVLCYHIIHLVRTHSRALSSLASHVRTILQSYSTLET
jgi:hypothetical protein